MGGYKTKVVREPSQPHKPGSIERRDFLKYLGGGILIAFVPFNGCREGEVPAPVTRSLPKDFNAFLHVGPDGMITCYTGKIEMGQGSITGLAQMMAEEMYVSVDSVKMVMGDTFLCPWDEGTWGSLSIRAFGPEMRKAAAEAREVMLRIAATKLKVTEADLAIRDGVIFLKSDEAKRLSYAEITKGKKIEKRLETAPRLKPHTEFTIVGKPHGRTDSVLKVTGDAKYTGDIKLPGMVFAKVVRSKYYGAKLLSADTSQAEKIEGIAVVRDKDFVALLHQNKMRLEEAILKVKAEFEPVQLDVTDKTFKEHYLKYAGEGNVINKIGNTDTGRKSASVIVESEFSDGYVAHSPMEPHAAAAVMEGDIMTVWASAQTPFPTRDAIAGRLEMPAEKVRVIVPFVGGGFGGKADNPQAVEAALIAKLSGKPVMLIYSREEEFFHDTLRPAGLNRVSSGFDSDGKITFWDFGVYFAGDRGSETIYDIPHQKTTVYDITQGGPQVHPFAIGPWRAPANSNNTHAREMQMCIMAAKAGVDQLDFRLKNLKDEKMKAVLKAVADKFGYTPRKGPSGRGFGLACGTDVDTWVALMAEVKVDSKTGKVQVVRVSCAQDMGMCVNPQGTLLQIEGCITMGMGYALSEELLFNGTEMVSLNYDSYEIPRFSWVPAIDAVILDRMDQAPHGGGEPAIICMGGVIGSAIFDATGAILYDMPMTPARVLDAIGKIKT